MESTIEQLFPGNVGRIVLTRVCLRMRRPDLLKENPRKRLPPDLIAALKTTRAEVQRG